MLPLGRVRSVQHPVLPLGIFQQQHVLHQDASVLRLLVLPLDVSFLQQSTLPLDVHLDVSDSACLHKSLCSTLYVSVHVL